MNSRGLSIYWGHIWQRAYLVNCGRTIIVVNMLILTQANQKVATQPLIYNLFISQPSCPSTETSEHTKTTPKRTTIVISHSIKTNCIDLRPSEKHYKSTSILSSAKKVLLSENPWSSWVESPWERSLWCSVACIGLSNCATRPSSSASNFTSSTCNLYQILKS